MSGLLKSEASSIAAILLGLVSIWSLRTASDTPSQPLIAEPAFLHFGDVRQGKVIKCEFLLSNMSKTPIVIDDVISGCGCAVAFTPETVIAPNASSRLVLNWDVGARRQETRVDSIVKYHLDGSSNAELLRFYTSAFVRPQMIVLPKERRSSDLDRSVLKVDVEVSRAEGWHTGHLSKVDVTHESIEARIVTNDQLSGNAMIEVRIRAVNLPYPHLLARAVTLHFAECVQEELSIPVESLMEANRAHKRPI
jgi:hypothetical protein